MTTNPINLDKSKPFQKFIELFKVFLESKLNRQWVVSGTTIQVYLRKGHHAFGGKLISTLDIANIEIGERSRRKGLGTAVIAKLHELNPYEVTYVENILNGPLYESLMKRDWINVSKAVIPCVYKPTEMYLKSFNQMREVENGSIP